MRKDVIAYHEAGHYVAAVFLHIPVKHVTIIADEGSNGHCTVVSRFSDQQVYEMSDRTEMKFWKHAMISLAGGEAQRIFRPSSVRSHHAVADRDHVADYVFRTAAPNEARLLIKLLTVRTRNLLTAHWADVEKVAAALLERKRLSDEEGRRVIFGDELVDQMLRLASRRDPHKKPVVT